MSTTSLPKAESSQKVNVFEHNSTVDLPLCHVDPNWNSEHVVNFLQTDRVGSGSYCAGGKKSGAHLDGCWVLVDRIQIIK